MKRHLASLAKRKGLKVFDSIQNEEKFVLNIWETDLKSIKERLNWNEIFETRAKLGHSTKGDLYWKRIHKKRTHYEMTLKYWTSFDSIWMYVARL